MKVDYKKLIISILVPLGLGALVGFITQPGDLFDTIIQPSFAPPAILFPIVWSILYILMGISSYLISESSDNGKNSALKVYYTQLIFNLLWSFAFFTFKWFLFSFIWILVLIILVIVMIIKFYKINKVSGVIQIPYLIWLIFASILNLSIYLLN